jgi:hypothetical protein
MTAKMQLQVVFLAGYAPYTKTRKGKRKSFSWVRGFVPKNSDAE